MITMQFGGWDNKHSTFKHIEKMEHIWYGQPSDADSYEGEIHKGHNTITWLELNWHVEGKQDKMEVSLIQNLEGQGKQVISCFPMKGHRANWLMLASGIS